MADHWVTIEGRHVLIEEDGGHSGTHNPITHTGNKTSDRAIRGQPDPNISSSDYVQKMAELRANAPVPIKKLWNNPALAPPDRVVEQEAKIKAWNAEYRKLSKLQKLAHERENAAFYARQAR